MQQNKMVEGLAPIQEGTSSCENCILEKQHRDSFPKIMSYRAKALLELVHTNLCGPR